MPKEMTSSLSSLLAISPLDGRYREQTASLADYYSEYKLIHTRLEIEIEWLIFLAAQTDLYQLPDAAALRQLVDDFSPEDAAEIKRIEAETRHDVKALEYWMRQRLDPAVGPYIHFCCTSWDINNLANTLMLRRAATNVLLPLLSDLGEALADKARQYKDLPMLSRTHGQAASPTTLGKEFANVAHRLDGVIGNLERHRFTGKFNGAVGNYNAHVVAYPQADWAQLAGRFVAQWELDFQSHTTQIEPYDNMVSFFNQLALGNSILLDLARDCWGYIAMDYFVQVPVAGEVGSSTMPHKINPIDFENAEGNLGVANALLQHFAQKLPVSRWQRDLSDSTVLRSVGSALGYCTVGYQSALRGLSKIEANTARLDADLSQNWQVLAEPIAAVLRRHGIVDAYEQLKALTRHGQQVDKRALHEFIESTPIPREAKDELLALTPQSYIGLAARLADQLPTRRDRR